MISASKATVYTAPTAGRRYFTKRAAINAEARAIIFNKHPIEKACYDSSCCGDPGYHIEHDEPKRFATMLRRMKRLIAAKVTPPNPAPAESRFVTALVRYESAAAELTRIKKAIVTTLEQCPITIEAYSDDGMAAYDRGHSVLWDGTRPNTHLHRALTNTVSDYCSERRLDQEEITDQLTDWDEDSEDACPHCLAAWNLILSRSEARREFGNAKRIVRALGKLAIKATPS